MSHALKALLVPFHQGLLPQPQRGFLLRAEADPALDEEWAKVLICEQSFKPAYDRLQRQKFRVERQLTGDGFDVGLCLLTKHKAENLANLGRAWAMVRPGGYVVGAGGNNVGGASMERALKAVMGEIGSLSKHHCKVFWTRRTENIPPPLTAWAEAGQLQLVPETGCHSRPGLYNWNKVDKGSALLVEHLPAHIAGRVADLGAGWGYLSAKLLERGDAMASLDLYEAEGQALEAAQANLARFQGPARLGFHWHDVTAGLPAAAFDTIVMNPPFHEGRETDMELGRAFISAAAHALAPKGRLIFVANRQLPYETTLQAKFRKFETLAETGTYKVFLAQL